MHQASATHQPLGHLPPASRPCHDSLSYSYPETNWQQPISSLHNSYSGHSEALSSQREIKKEQLPAYPVSWPHTSTAITPPSSGRLPTPPQDDMSVFPHTQSNSGGIRQSSVYTSIPSSSYQSTGYSNGYGVGEYSSRALEARFVNNQQAVSQNYDAYGGQDGQRAAPAAQRVQEEVQEKQGIHPDMQIPPSVNNSGGSIGELAAQMTCLFWFETTETLRKAENWSPDASPVQRLVPDATPTVPFRKWVITILTTTKVTPNVILLALLFIYRLKTLNPTVKGKAGSEYRLLTVALMLGNKFLDDNTYTNKTWAEVSGISVGEIHVMEVEFLSNMRYNLLATEQQWAEWQAKLGRFAAYYEKASRATAISPRRSEYAPPVLPSPTSLQPSPPAYSPQSSQQSAYTAPKKWSAPQYLSQPAPAMRHKRTHEDLASVLVEPPAKRPALMQTSYTAPTMSETHQQHPLTMIPNISSLPSQQLPSQRQPPRLPIPNLSVNTSQPSAYPSLPQTLPPLPPLNGRAMAQVYPITPGYTPQPTMTLPPTSGLAPQQPYLPSSNYGTPSRRQSPRSVGVHSMNSSPISGIFPPAIHESAMASHTNSPIYYQQRNSPYKPTRLPHTLLYPPPSGSFQHYQPPPLDHMHWHSLGKRSMDLRTGVVPEFQQQGYSQTQWQPSQMQLQSVYPQQS